MMTLFSQLFFFLGGGYLVNFYFHHTESTTFVDCQWLNSAYSLWSKKSCFNLW